MTPLVDHLISMCDKAEADRPGSIIVLKAAEVAELLRVLRDTVSADALPAFKPGDMALYGETPVQVRGFYRATDGQWWYYINNPNADPVREKRLRAVTHG